MEDFKFQDWLQACAWCSRLSPYLSPCCFFPCELHIARSLRWRILFGVYGGAIVLSGPTFCQRFPKPGTGSQDRDATVYNSGCLKTIQPNPSQTPRHNSICISTYLYLHCTNPSIFKGNKLMLESRTMPTLLQAFGWIDGLMGFMDRWADITWIWVMMLFRMINVHVAYSFIHAPCIDCRLKHRFIDHSIQCYFCCTHRRSTYKFHIKVFVWLKTKDRFLTMSNQLAFLWGGRVLPWPWTSSRDLWSFHAGEQLGQLGAGVGGMVSIPGIGDWH